MSDRLLRLYPHEQLKPDTYMATVRDRLAEALATGTSVAGACRYAGLPKSTFDFWMRRGNPESDDYVGKDGTADPSMNRDYEAFYTEMMAIVGTFELEVVQTIRNQTHRDYRAGIELLQRRFPEDWAPPVNKNETKATLTHDFTALAESVRSKLLPEFASGGAVVEAELTDDRGTSHTAL